VIHYFSSIGGWLDSRLVHSTQLYSIFFFFYCLPIVLIFERCRKDVSPSGQMKNAYSWFFNSVVYFQYGVCYGTHHFDLFCTSTYRLYLEFISTCTSRPIRNPDLTKGRSTEVEVNEPKYRKGPRYENGRSPENVALMLMVIFQKQFCELVSYDLVPYKEYSWWK